MNINFDTHNFPKFKHLNHSWRASNILQVHKKFIQNFLYPVDNCLVAQIEKERIQT